MSVVPLIIRPDSAEPGAAGVFVAVRVGETDVEFLLDTGGAISRIGRDAVPPLRVAGAVPGGNGALGSSAPQARAIIPALRLGDVVAIEVEVEVADADAAGPPAILGLDVLGSHRLGVRFSQGMLELDEGSSVDKRRPMTVSSHRHPYVEIDLGGTLAPAVVDTGAGLTVVDRQFVDRHPDLFERRRASSGRDAVGNTSDTPIVRMAECRIGGRDFSATPAAVFDIAGIQAPGDPAFELILGYPVLSQADWLLDIPQREWGFIVG